MSHALTALILINIDAHKGEWCTVAWLAGKILAPQRLVQPICDKLVDEGQLDRSFCGGERCYGVAVIDEHPVLNSTHQATVAASAGLVSAADVNPRAA